VSLTLEDIVHPDDIVADSIATEHAGTENRNPRHS
jgi:hypothetical protein